MEAQIREIVTKISQFIATYYIIIAFLSAIPYLFKSYGISKVAKTVNARYRWLCWIPIMRYHVVSQIADMHRISVGKNQKVTAAFEISTFLTLVLITGIISTKKIFLLIPIIAIIPIIKFTQLFATYYFFRYCDKENATIFFILALGSNILNAIFFFNCRNKGGRYYNYR